MGVTFGESVKERWQGSMQMVFMKGSQYLGKKVCKYSRKDKAKWMHKGSYKLGKKVRSKSRQEQDKEV